MGMRVKKSLHESIVVPTVMYGGESWGMREEEKRKLNVMEMNCLRNMCGVSRREHVHNEEVRRRVGVEIELAERVEERVLSWFGHVERMSGERMTKRVYESSVVGSRGRGAPPKGWMSCVKKILYDRGMTIANAKVVCQTRSDWRAIVYGGGIF